MNNERLLKLAGIVIEDDAGFGQEFDQAVDNLSSLVVKAIAQDMKQTSASKDVSYGAHMSMVEGKLKQYVLRKLEDGGQIDETVRESLAKRAKVRKLIGKAMLDHLKEIQDITGLLPEGDDEVPHKEVWKIVNDIVRKGSQ